MTLIERIDEVTERDAFDRHLFQAVATVPGVVALAVTDRPSGTIGVLVIDDKAVDLDEAEAKAFELMPAFEAERAAHHPFDLVVLPLSTAEDAYAFGETARVFDLRTASAWLRTTGEVPRRARNLNK